MAYAGKVGESRFQPPNSASPNESRPLGAVAADTVRYTNDNLTIRTLAGKTSITGDGVDQITIEAELRDGS